MDHRIQRRRDFFDRAFDFLRGRALLLECSTAANSRRLREAQRGLLTCRPRAMPKPSGGTFSVIVEPAATYAPSPIRTGASRVVSLPMKTPRPMVVGCFPKPS